MRRLLLPGLAGLLLALPANAMHRRPPERLAWNDPVQITAEADPVMDAATTPDGRLLAYVSGGGRFRDLWLRSADPRTPLLPRQLTEDPGDEIEPALSADGRWLAYVGTGYDVKGDIYLLDLSNPQTVPRRLTGRSSEDRHPCLAPDGHTLYFQTATAGGAPALAALDLTRATGNEPLVARPLDAGGDAESPAIADDGRSLAFVSRRVDPGGDLYLLDLQDGRVRPLTRGPERDGEPAWVAGGSRLLFTRRSLDSNADGRLDDRDPAAVYSLDPRQPSDSPAPLTSGAHSATRPMPVSGPTASAGEGRVLFLSARGGVANVWSLPTGGEVPELGDPDIQLFLARRIEGRLPRDPHAALLAYAKVEELHRDTPAAAVPAALAAGEILAGLGHESAALAAFHRALDTSATAPNPVQPEEGLARLAVARIQTNREWRSARGNEAKGNALADGLARLAEIAGMGVARVAARAGLEQGRLLLERGGDATSVQRAVAQLARTVAEYPGERDVAAEALLLRADGLARVGLPAQVEPAYRELLTRYADVSAVADQAVERILDLRPPVEDSPDARIRDLRRVEEENRESVPYLAAGALLRIGDLWFAENEWARAKEAYRQVLAEATEMDSVRAAARLALAEILYREERYRQALDLYETELGERPLEDRIYRLARRGYIRRTLAAGERLLQTGEVASARALFRDLIRYDESSVPAHRGYIRASAALGAAPAVLTEYRGHLAAAPTDPLALYAIGLALTYQEGRAPLDEARKLLGRAVAAQGQVEYFHQTLGYVLEVLETVHGEKGLLERAAESYRKALFLNDPREDPDNRAHLLLNVGNAHFLLGQPALAYRYYTERLEHAVPFPAPETEILFYRRLGTAAFQVNEPAATVQAFEKALELLRARAEPKGASAAFDRLQRTLADGLLGPHLQGDDPAPSALALARRQSDLRTRVFDATRTEVPAVPSPGWAQYRAAFETLLPEQEGVVRDTLAYLPTAGLDPAAVEQARLTLNHQLQQVRDALTAPLRFAELETELLDRLALAYQEAERWGDAAATFDQVFEHNRAAGKLANLARNRRGAAYNRYRLAELRTGAERDGLLAAADAGFREALALVREHGVPEQARKEGGGLVNLSLSVSLDEAGGTQAARGFSAAQEERLAEAFLGRIAVEQGSLDAARAAAAVQLQQYPPGSPIAEGDRYGVSLLHHRAGLAAFAVGDLPEAAARFRDSSGLALDLGNAASGALNLANLARVLTARAEAGASPAELWSDASGPRGLEELERRLAGLLRDNPVARGSAAVRNYYAAAGLGWLGLARAPGVGVDGGVRRVRALGNAVQRFRGGLGALEAAAGAPPRTRSDRAAAARLHLGLGFAVAALGEGSASRDAHWRRALSLAREAAAPDLEWRALAALGQLPEALAVLRDTPFTRAYAAPGEITGAFSPMVEARLSADEPTEAITLMEELAELERVHRLAPLFLGELSTADRALLREAMPRLLRLRTLRASLAATSGEEQTYRQESLTREEKLLAATLGPERERLPRVALLTGPPDLQEAVAALLGLALEAEEAADPAAETELRKRSAVLLEEAVAEFPAAGPLLALAPRPAEVAEVMGALSEDALVRTWRSSDGSYRALVLTAEDFAAAAGDNPAELMDAAATAATGMGARSFTLAVEDPTAFFHDGPKVAATYALSATHWLRCRSAAKPFTREVWVAGGEPHAEADAFLADAYTLHRTSELSDWAGAAAAHTVVLDVPVRRAHSVPTREREVGHALLAAVGRGGRTLPLTGLLESLPRASLALLPRATPELTFELGHVLALAGCPTLALPQPGQAVPWAEFLAGAAGTSVFSAAGESGWVLVGFRGLEPEEAEALAAARFQEYVHRAQAARQEGRHAAALGLAEDALLVADQVAAFSGYRGDLYRFAREAAYGAGDVPRATDYAERLVQELARTRPDSEAHADALLRLGLLRARLERYQEAVPALEAAAEMLANLDRSEAAVEALADMGVVLENATEYDRALESFRTAADLSRELDLTPLLAAQQVNIGRLYDLRLSQYARAKQAYHEALELYDASGDLAGVIRALVDAGRCDRLLGNFPAADQRYSQALELLEEEPDPILRAKVRIEQANNAWFQARYQESFEIQGEVLETARSLGWDLGQVLAHNTGGLTWWTLGDNERALRELERARSLAEAIEGRADEVATSLNNIGLVQREMGHYDAALETLQRALAIDRRLRSRWAIAYDLRNLGLTHLRRGDPATALPLLREAAAEAGAIGDRVNQAKALLAVAQALWATGEGREAEDLFGAALDAARDMVLREVEWRALHGLAEIHLRRGDRAGARDLLEMAVTVVEGMRAAIRLEQLRDGFLANKLDVYRALVGILVEEGDTEAAFAVAERSRSRNFIDLLGTQRLRLQGAVDQELYERHLTLKARMQEQEALLAQARSDEEKEAYRGTLVGLQDQVRDLLLEMQRRNPQLAALVSVQPTGSAETLARLDPGVVLLSYYVLTNETLCWVLGEGRVELVRLPLRAEDLGEEIFAYRRLIQNLEPIEAASSALHRKLLDPVLPLLGNARILGIVPHGPLHYLSFATLGDTSGYLVERYPLFYLPSSSVLRYTLERRQEQPNRKVLAIGNPNLGDPALALPFAEQEVGTIRWNFPDVTLLTGARATEDWVVRHLGEFGVIHLASHGEFDPVNPLFSALKLAKDDARDGDLQASEVFTLEINADLVVLSACQTGLGRVTPGDDVIGLNRAFFYAGTHAIVSSLWRVSDISTALLMKQFYRRYSELDKAASLRAGMLHVKRRYPHPGYWGAFTLSGDWL